MVFSKHVLPAVMLAAVLGLGAGHAAGVPEDLVSSDQARREFIKGNILYKQQQYPQAAAVYETVLAAGWANGALYYNLGNAYFKQDDLGRAVLNYERALRLMPRDADVKANYRLAVSLTRSGAGQEPLPWPRLVLEKMFASWTADELAVAAVALLFLAAAVHVLGLHIAFPRRRLAAMVLLLSAGLTLTTVFVRLNSWCGQAVVVAPAACRFEPRDGATVHFELDSGAGVRILDQEAGWRKVRRGDGKAGWVKGESVEEI